MADLQLRGVHKSFGAVPVIHNVDLDVRDGEFVVFVGPSGCGKSTLLRTISGLEEPMPARSSSAARTSPISIRPSAALQWCSSPTRSIRT